MFTQENHTFVFNKNLRREVCVKCGLLMLNNPFTHWCVRNGCNSREHPGYSAARKQYTGKK